MKPFRDFVSSLVRERQKYADLPLSRIKEEMTRRRKVFLEPPYFKGERKKKKKKKKKGERFKISV